MKDFKFGFTLAEVLITLSIIGVVAAVTLPNLSSNVNNKALGIQAKKTYNTLSNATAMYLADKGADKLSQTSFDVTAFIEKYLKPVSKDSATSGISGHQVMSGTEYILNDGSSITVPLQLVNVFPIKISVDTNGAKGPNKTNYDKFTLNIFDDGKIDDDSFNTSSDALSATQSALKTACAKGTGTKCFGYLIRNGFEMDYDD